MQINENELIGELDKIIEKSSIAYRVSDIQPLSLSSGFAVGVRKDKITKKLITHTKEITAKSREIDSSYTQESLEDLSNLYNKTPLDLLLSFMSDELTYEIDKDFINMIRDRASLHKSITFDSSYDNGVDSIAFSIVMLVNKGLSDLPISDNRSPIGWAIVSSDIGALLSGIIPSANSTNDNSPSYIGKIGGVEYYIDYTNDNSNSDIIFGIKGNGITRGSTIYSHFTKSIISKMNEDNLHQYYWLLDRTSLNINPLDDEYKDSSSGYLGKIEVDLKSLNIFS